MPPFDPSAYARIVDENLSLAGGSAARASPRTLTAATPAAPPSGETSQETTETIGRAMYGSYLSSDFPEALVLAERVLEKQPDHALAQLVAERCRAVLEDTASIEPTSVVRLRTSPAELRAMGLDALSEYVLGHVDGVVDATTIADLAGIPRAAAYGRLGALLDRGVVELVS